MGFPTAVSVLRYHLVGNIFCGCRMYHNSNHQFAQSRGGLLVAVNDFGATMCQAKFSTEAR